MTDERKPLVLTQRFTLDFFEGETLCKVVAYDNDGQRVDDFWITSTPANFIRDVLRSTRRKQRK